MRTSWLDKWARALDVAALMALCGGFFAARTAFAVDAKPAAPDIPPEVRQLLFGEEPTAAPRPAPRAADGHPDLSGFFGADLKSGSGGIT